MEASEFDALETYLRHARFDVEDIFETVIGGAHGGKVKLILHGGVAVIVKPEDGTSDKALAVPREEAGWVTARNLGLPTLVACTVQRKISLEGQSVNAAVQVLWPDATPDSAASVHDFSDDQVLNAAVFDVISNHTDHSHNFSAAPSQAGVPRLRLYDNGYAFDFPGRSFSSAFYEEAKDRDIPEEMLGGIARFIDLAPDSPLEDLLGSAAFRSSLERAKGLLEAERITNIEIPN